MVPVPELGGLALARSTTDGKLEPLPQADSVMLVRQARQATAVRAGCPAALDRRLIGKIEPRQCACVKRRASADHRCRAVIEFATGCRAGF